MHGLREAYLADKARKEARRAALRTRDGVIDLTEWRAAAQAKHALEKLMGWADWLLEVRVAASKAIGCELVATLLWDAEQARVSMPSAVDDVPVRVEIRNGTARP